MFKKLFMLFRIGRKLSTSGAISSVYEIYNPPLVIKVLFFIIGFNFKNEDLKLYQSKNHLLDWVTSIKNGTEPICHAEIGHRSASVCHLSNIAYELREELHWDPINESFIDNKKANLMRSKIYRDPYSVDV